MAKADRNSGEFRYETSGHDTVELRAILKRPQPFREFARQPLTVVGDYTQSASGQLTVYLDGASGNQILITGVASLAGGFTGLLEEGVDPGPGDRFFVLSYASHSGEFDSYSLPPLSAGSWEWWYDDPEYPNTFGLQVVA